VNDLIAEIANSLAIKSVGYSSHLAVELTIGKSTTHTNIAEIECISWCAAKQEKFELVWRTFAELQKNKNIKFQASKQKL